MTTDHKFDRRGTDPNVSALSVRVSGLEGRMEHVEQEVRANSRELVANTTLTRQVHTMAERVEQNTQDIVAAVQWLSTTKKIVIVLVAGIGGLAAAASGVVGFAKLVGIL